MKWIYLENGEKVKDITGNKYNHLTAIRFSHKGKWNHAYWLFKCDCGKEKIISANTVTKKNAEVKSCGCQNDLVRKSGVNRRIHGDNSTRLYKVWKSMRNRCNNSDDLVYGARGIKVCKEWNDYRLFKLWALSNGYDEEADFMQCTLDRIDVDGNYEPSNCRWVSCKIQSRNKTNMRYIKWKGEEHTPIEWEEITGIKSSIIRTRIDICGWSIEEALSIPKGMRRKDWVKHNEKTE